MASPTAPRTSPRWRSTNPASAASIARRAWVNEVSASIIVERLHAERPVGQLRELLHARFRLGQRARRVAQAGDALLEERERFGEVERLPLQPVDDRLEAREALLDRRHRSLPRAGRTAVVVASTSPSRSRSTNRSPGEKAVTPPRAPPSTPRAAAYPRSSVARGDR